MKRNILLAVLLCAALLTACSGNGNDDSNATANGNQAETKADTATVSLSADTATAEESTVKTLYGEISEVIGNALIIKEIEMPVMSMVGERFSMMSEDGEITLPDGTVIPVGEDGRPDFSGVDLSGFEMPEGMSFDRDALEQRGQRQTEGGGPSFSTGESAGSFDGEGAMAVGEGGPITFDGGEAMRGGGAIGRRMGQNYTGEEIEVIIPVGIPIMTRTMGEEGIEEKEITLNNLSSGDTVTITYKEDGINIDTVFITQSSAMGNSGGFAGNEVFFSRGGEANITIMERVGP